uniref:Glycoprotein n=1 Tax=Matula phasmavirus TaxID=3078421 RepID=A0AB38Z1Q7_9VIRU
MKGESGVFRGWHYGIIDYVCDDVEGILVSKMTCKDCGIYCVENEMIQGCEKSFLPWIISTILALLLLLVTCCLWVSVGKKIVLMLWDAAQRRLQLFKNERKEKRVRRYKKYSQNENVALETLAVEEPSNEPVNMTQRSPYFVMLALCLMLPNTAIGCDNTLYITSHGTICTDDKCYSSQMTELALMSDESICFRDVDGNVLKIKIEKAELIYRSQLQYLTSETTLTTETHSECKGGSEGNCWNKGCLRNSVHNKLKKTPKKSEVIGYGCDSDSIGCDTWCWHQTSCVYFRWTISPIGELFNVYRIISKQWRLSVSMNYKNITKIYSFNVNNPKMNLDHVGLTSMPLYITGFNSEEPVVDNYIIKVSDEYFNIPASDRNMPETDKIGDFQVAIEGGNATYNENSIHCQSGSCEATCDGPKPKLSRFLARRNEYLKLPSRKIQNYKTIISRVQVKALTKLMIGNIDINDLKVSPAHCNIDLVTTFGCTGCQLDSYAVLQASNIKEEGQLVYTSNCTFSESYIPCSPQPFKLTLIGEQNYCKIFIPTRNISIILDFTFVFMGSLDPSVQMYSTSSEVDEILNMVKTPNFMNVVGYTWFGLSIITILLSMIVRYCTCPLASMPAFYFAKKAVDKV